MAGGIDGQAVPELKTARVSKAHAVARASQPRNHAVWGMTMARRGNQPTVKPADGCRGRQERN